MEILETIPEEQDYLILTETCLQGTPFAICARYLEAEACLQEHKKLEAANIYEEMAAEYKAKYPEDTHHYACLLVARAVLKGISIEGKELFINAANEFSEGINKIKCLYSAANVYSQLWFYTAYNQSTAAFLDILESYRQAMDMHASSTDLNRYDTISFYFTYVNKLMYEFTTEKDILLPGWRSSFQKLKQKAAKNKKDEFKEIPIEAQSLVLDKNLPCLDLVEIGNQAWQNLRFKDMQNAYGMALQQEGISADYQSRISVLMNTLCESRYHEVMIYYPPRLTELDHSAVIESSDTWITAITKKLKYPSADKSADKNSGASLR